MSEANPDKLAELERRIAVLEAHIFNRVNPEATYHYYKTSGLDVPPNVSLPKTPQVFTPIKKGVTQHGRHTSK